ncbi:MAG: MiaB/RimO family radical SAM methylthiotransferase [Planctomycetota bacterium]|jgi:ribosomal protein S12 methylthiotransferase
MSPSEPVKLGVISLGCPRNLVDTERALGQMLSDRVVLLDDLAVADWIIVNTCGFIDEAKQESIDAILEVSRLKETNPRLRIAVVGCLSERFGDQLAVELPEVDFFAGILTRHNVAALEAAMTGAEPHCALAEETDLGRLRLTLPHVGYLRIAEGCNNRCSYCAIPLIRGPLKSRPFENVIADAEELLEGGVVELNVVAQDTTAYGLDRNGKRRLGKLLLELALNVVTQDVSVYSLDRKGKGRLGELLRELARLNPDGWVRLLYAHPAHIDEEVIDVIASGYPIVPYVDLPLQHINDRILSLMGRKVTRRQVEATIRKLRERIPGVFIRTAFIVGFPGETEDEFRELLDFVRETRFERLGAFVYSREEGTTAAGFSPHVSKREKKRRLDALMGTQQRVAFELNASLVGRRILGIIDGVSDGEGPPLVGRTYGDAPEVDGSVYIAGEAEPGRIVTLEVTGVEDYDLTAEIVK